jgi:DnaJ family protein B protein 4
MSSYYDILEIDRNADDNDIKRSYRRKSLIYHPDRPNGDSEKFKQISTAYETLGDKNKRKQYDFEQQFQGSPPFGMFPGSTPFMNMRTNINEEDVNDLFSTLFGHVVAEGMHGPRFGGGGLDELFSKQSHKKTSVKPESINIQLIITFEQCYQGCSLPIVINRSIMISDTKINEEETVYIDIYKGIDTNEIIILNDKGNVNDEQIKGDVKVIIIVENTTQFNREGLDLIFHKNLSLKESLCGFSFDIEHLNNKKLAFNNKSNTTLVKPNYRKKIPNMGLTRKDKTGSLIIVFDIVFPDKLDQEQMDKLNDIL